MQTLNDRVAIVTGGAVRIGRAITEALRDQGARVVLHYGQSRSPAHELAETAPDRIRLVQADLTDPLSAASRIVGAAWDAFGRADILVNNAAIFEAADLRATTESLWDRHFAINLKAPYFLAQAFAQRTPDSAPRCILNIVDWRGTRPVPGHDAYTLTKAGLAAMTRLLAQELGPNIRVNGIAPGAILPPPGSSREELDARCQHIPLARAGGPQAIVDALLYLLQTDFVTGEIVHVTGGEHL